MHQGKTPPRRSGRPPAAYVLLGNHRTLIMGILGTVAGVVGTVGGISAGAGVLDTFGFVGIGLLGLALTIGYVVVAANRPRYEAGRR